MAESLNVQMRESHGKRRNKRMRNSGSIPAVLYGHGEASHSLTVSADELNSVLRHHGRIVELKGAVNEKALLRELQWDIYGTHVLHVDFARVSEHERIEVKVSVELRGQAVGVKDGGVIQHFIHEIEIECEALSIPEKLELNISNLKLDESLHVSDLPLPAGVTLVSDPDGVIVHCVQPRDEDESAGLGGGAAEPEVIGRKAGEDEEGEE